MVKSRAHRHGPSLLGKVHSCEGSHGPGTNYHCLLRALMSHGRCVPRSLLDKRRQRSDLLQTVQVCMNGKARPAARSRCCQGGNGS